MITAELLDRAVFGRNAQALGALVDFIYGRVKQVLPPGSPDVDDVTTIAFMKVLSAIEEGRFDPDHAARPSAWVSVIAVNAAKDCRRSVSGFARIHTSGSGDDHEEGADPAGAHARPGPRADEVDTIPLYDLVDTRQRIELLRLAFDTLEPEARGILFARYYEELTVEETAAALDLAEGTVKSRTSRALTLLRKACRELEGQAAVPKERAGA